jgi:hypothetical protein
MQLNAYQGIFIHKRFASFSWHIYDIYGSRWIRKGKFSLSMENSHSVSRIIVWIYEFPFAGVNWIKRRCNSIIIWLKWCNLQIKFMTGKMDFNVSLKSFRTICQRFNLFTLLSFVVYLEFITIYLRK